MPIAVFVITGGKLENSCVNIHFDSHQFKLMAQFGLAFSKIGLSKKLVSLYRFALLHCNVAK